MAKYIKVRWIKTPVGGGVSLQCFREFKEEERVDDNGFSTFYRSKIAIDNTIQVNRGKSAVHRESGTTLYRGEFMVQDILFNREVLARKLKKNHMRVTDWDLHYEILGEPVPDQSEEIVTEDEMVSMDTTHAKSPQALKKAAELKAEHMNKVNEEVKAKEEALKGKESAEKDTQEALELARKAEEGRIAGAKELAEAQEKLKAFEAAEAKKIKDAEKIEADKKAEAKIAKAKEDAEKNKAEKK